VGILKSFQEKMGIYHYIERLFEECERKPLLTAFGTDKFEQFDIRKTVSGINCSDFHFELDKDKITILSDCSICEDKTIRVRFDEKLNIINILEKPEFHIPEYPDTLLDGMISLDISTPEQQAETAVDSPSMAETALDMGITNCRDMTNKYQEINKKVKEFIQNSYSRNIDLYTYYEKMFSTFKKETLLKLFGTDNILEFDIGNVVNRFEYPDIVLNLNQSGEVKLEVDYYPYKEYWDDLEHSRFNWDDLEHGRFNFKLDQNLNIITRPKLAGNWIAI
jgi:hypothetical protein